MQGSGRNSMRLIQDQAGTLKCNATKPVHLYHFNQVIYISFQIFVVIF